MNNNQINAIANNELNMLLNHYNSSATLFCKHLTNAYIYNQKKYPKVWKQINDTIFNMINNDNNLGNWVNSSILENGDDEDE